MMSKWAHDLFSVIGIRITEMLALNALAVKEFSNKNKTLVLSSQNARFVTTRLTFCYSKMLAASEAATDSPLFGNPVIHLPLDVGRQCGSKPPLDSDNLERPLIDPVNMCSRP